MKPLCEDCEAKFQMNQGQLQVSDMCEDCREDVIFSIIEDTPAERRKNFYVIQGGRHND